MSTILEQFKMNLNTFRTNVEAEAKKINRIIVCGHMHVYEKDIHYEILDSYLNGSTYTYNINGNKYLVIADAHLCSTDYEVSQTDEYLIGLVNKINEINPCAVIFLGDTGDYLQGDNDSINLSIKYIVSRVKCKIYWILGNHDANLVQNCKKIDLELNAVKELDIGNYRFTHGMNYDNVWNKWYLRLWSYIGDTADSFSKSIMNWFKKETSTTNDILKDKTL